MADQFVEDIWVGSEIGYLKAVDLKKKSFNNVAGPSTGLADKKAEEIRAMCWANDERNQMFLGLRNGLVKTYDVDQSSFVGERDCEVQDSHIVGLSSCDRSIVTCTESGALRVWPEDDSTIEVNVGTHISTMHSNHANPHHVGTGGRENDLKIWDLSRSGENIFKAKNVRNDTLDLRVPVWVTDLAFLPSNSSLPKVVTGTGYHQLRLYDTAAKKRPVLSIDFEECPITTISVTNQEFMVIIGNTAGTLATVDMRKGQVVNHFKGFAGGIRCVQYCERLGQVAACGLDRFLRVYDFKSRNLTHKVYLKTRLNCLLFSSAEKLNQKLKSCGESIDESEFLSKRVRTENDDDDESEVDEIWDSMEVVKTHNLKSNKISSKKISSKKKAKK